MWRSGAVVAAGALVGGAVTGAVSQASVEGVVLAAVTLIVGVALSLAVLSEWAEQWTWYLSAQLFTVGPFHRRQATKIANASVEGWEEAREQELKMRSVCWS